jgi:hypothetical protein
MLVSCFSTVCSACTNLRSLAFESPEMFFKGGDVRQYCRCESRICRGSVWKLANTERLDVGFDRGLPLAFRQRERGE